MKPGVAASLTVLLILAISPAAAVASVSAHAMAPAGPSGRPPPSITPAGVIPNPRRVSSPALLPTQTVNPTKYYSSEPAPMGIADFGVSASGAYEYATNSSLGVAYIGSLSTHCTSCGGYTRYMTIQLNVVLQFVAHGNTYAYWIQDVPFINTGTSGEYEPELEDNIWNFTSTSASMTSKGVSGSGTVAPSGTDSIDYYGDVASSSFSGNEVYVNLPSTMQLEVNSTLNGSGQPVVKFSYDDGYGWQTYDTVTFLASDVTSMVGFLVDGFNYNPYGLYYESELILGGPGDGYSTEDMGSDVQLQLEYLNGHNYQMITSSYNFGSNTGETISDVLPSAHYYSNNGSLYSYITTGSGTPGELYDKSQVAVVSVNVPFSVGYVKIGSSTPSSSLFAGGQATVTIEPGTWLFEVYEGTSSYAQASLTLAANETYTMGAALTTPSGTTPYLDTFSAGAMGSSPLSASITTTNSNDLIMVIVAAPSSNSLSGPTGSGLTFSARCTANGDGLQVQSFVAVSSGTLSNKLISETFSGGGTGTLLVIAVSGTDTAAPFDPNLSACPAGVTGSGGSASVSFSTTGTGDLLVGSIAITGSSPSYAVEAGYSDIARNGAAYDAEGETTSVPGAQSVSYAVSGTSLNWAMIGDALVSPSGIPDLPFGVLPLIISIAVIYYLARRVESSSLRIPGKVPSA